MAADERRQGRRPSADLRGEAVARHFALDIFRKCVRCGDPPHLPVPSRKGQLAADNVRYSVPLDVQDFPHLSLVRQIALANAYRAGFDRHQLPRRETAMGLAHGPVGTFTILGFVQCKCPNENRAGWHAAYRDVHAVSHRTARHDRRRLAAGRASALRCALAGRRRSRPLANSGGSPSRAKSNSER